jgi:hypothetical protein
VSYIIRSDEKGITVQLRYIDEDNWFMGPYCECGCGKETVEHYLLECPKHWEQRKTLRKNVGTGRMKMRILLGDIKMIKHTMEYITTTRRLE